ncbi:MAG: hypothetical protein AMXMBFR61_11320 [Fimbriimonadales bacterium]
MSGSLDEPIEGENGPCQLADPEEKGGDHSVGQRSGQVHEHILDGSRFAVEAGGSTERIHHEVPDRTATPEGHCCMRCIVDDETTEHPEEKQRAVRVIGPLKRVVAKPCEEQKEGEV